MSDAFDKSKQAAIDAAMKRRRKTGAVLDKAATARAAMPEPVPTINSADRVMINNVTVPSVDYVDEMGAGIRADLNEVIDNLDVSGSREIKLVAPDLTELGKLDELTHKMFDTLVRCMNIKDARGNRKNIMIKGPLGGGKSTSGKQAAKLMDTSFDYIGQTNMPHEVMGYMHPTLGEYMWTAFTKAYVEGGIVYLEEMDGWSANATLVLNPPLANGYITLPNGETHERHPDCVVVACTNTWGTGPTAEYVGRNKLDSAFLDRFGIKLNWDYDEELERRAARDDDVVSIVQTARFNAARYGVKVPISPRCSIDIADMVRHGFSMKEALDMNFLAGVDKDQREMLLEDCVI